LDFEIKIISLKLLKNFIFFNEELIFNDSKNILKNLLNLFNYEINNYLNNDELNIIKKFKNFNEKNIDKNNINQNFKKLNIKKYNNEILNNYIFNNNFKFNLNYFEIIFLDNFSSNSIVLEKNFVFLDILKILHLFSYFLNHSYFFEFLFSFNDFSLDFFLLIFILFLDFFHWNNFGNHKIFDKNSILLLFIKKIKSENDLDFYFAELFKSLVLLNSIFTFHSDHLKIFSDFLLNSNLNSDFKNILFKIFF
jgi:hypothetical protein